MFVAVVLVVVVVGPNNDTDCDYLVPVLSAVCCGLGVLGPHNTVETISQAVTDCLTDYTELY